VPPLLPTEALCDRRSPECPVARSGAQVDHGGVDDHRRVLVVEDNEDIRSLLDAVLGLSGYEVVLAEDGREALRLLVDVHLAPDLAILDVEMPDLSGWEVLRSIRGNDSTADLPVIVCSVRGSDADLDRGRSLGCDGYLQKPFDIDELVAEVGEVIARSTGS
jgi:DNA-binding response OmpR family regulator